MPCRPARKSAPFLPNGEDHPPALLGGVMADAMRVMLEMGPKSKKVVAVAPD
jgi:hypothetical protein